MAKTRRIIKESLPTVDAVTEILDARMPISSQNPELGELIGGKPLIVLLNKSDMADENATRQWIDYFKKKAVAVLAVDCKSGNGLNKFIPTLKEALKDKIASNEARGMGGKPIRIMVVGIPNIGKSSFINRMAGKNRAKVADKAGVTRRNQWFAIANGIELLDTPGVLWPKFDNPTVGDRLAFIGSVKDEVFDNEALAVRLLEVLVRDYPDRLVHRYKIDNFDNLQPYEVLELIGRKRGMIIKGGEVDTLRAAVMLLDEYRGGKLGKITLDKIGEFDG